MSIVGCIGLGNMGSALAGNLVAAGLDVLAHDLAGPGRCPRGATFADSASEVAARAQAVLLSLPDGSACEVVARAIAGAPASRVRHVVDTSTIGLRAAREVAALLGGAGVGYVDAPVSGGVAGARARTLTVMYAGDAESCEAVLPLLEGLSDRRFHVGDEPGMAQAVKLANNFLSATALAATSEAVAFVTSVGVDMVTMLEVLNASSGRSAASEDKFANHVVTGTFSSGFANTLMAKDVQLYVEAAGAQAVGAVTADIWRRFAESRPGVDFTTIYSFTKER